MTKKDNSSRSPYKNLGRMPSHILYGERDLGTSIGIFLFISIVTFIASMASQENVEVLQKWFTSISIASVPTALTLLLVFRQRYITRKREYYGNPTLIIDRRKGYVGRELCGFVELKPRLTQNELITVRLECINFVPRPVDPDRGPTSPMEKTICFDQYVTTVLSSPLHSQMQAIPVDFYIPAGSEHTQGTKFKGIGWRISVRCQRSGIDLWERFDVNVVTGERVLKESGIMEHIGGFVRR